MGTHHATREHDRLGGLVGRGVLTAAAALALGGGGTGVAFAADVPVDDGPDTSQAQDHHGEDCSCEDQDDGQDQDADSDEPDSDDPGWYSDGDEDDGQDTRSGEPAPTHHHATHGSDRPSGSHAPSTEKIAPGAAGKTVPITSGVMR